MDVIIVCHTEFGFVSGKDVIFAKEAIEGVRVGCHNLIKLADKYGAKVTFAICPEVVEYFPARISHEIGLHIHPGWEEFSFRNFKLFVGDRLLRDKCRQSGSSSVLRDYSYQEQLDMISAGKGYLAEVSGKEPRVFVAGRWSINNDTIAALVKTGFTHDCSAVPHQKPCHYDWSKLPRICMPYHPAPEDYQKQGNLPILLVPISQYFPSGSVNPETAPFVGISWMKACFLEYYRQDAPLFHICLHSPAMTDPYFISTLERILAFISKHTNINFKFASEIGEYPKKEFKTNIVPYLLRANKEIIKSCFRKIVKVSTSDR
jgi:peptidoglycan/xylan/chitin deacetylase (PgdA/CDA1 family)